MRLTLYYATQKRERGNKKRKKQTFEKRAREMDRSKRKKKIKRNIGSLYSCRAN